MDQENELLNDLLLYAHATGTPLDIAFDLSGAITRAAESFGSFGPLKASGEEASQLKEWYLRFRKDEPAETWSGAAASETRLKALTAPPRVLHLATHGFYLPGSAPEPMLLSGVALAGANRALAKNEDDGILFALEAQGLNLDGSELVVPSACDTARGSLDYAEGVYGLVRAFRTAGARNVLVTLWPLNDGEARDFMTPSIAPGWRKPGTATRPRRCAKPASPTSTTPIRCCATQECGRRTFSWSDRMKAECGRWCWALSRRPSSCDL